MSAIRQRHRKLYDVAFFQEGPGLRDWQWADEGMKVINGTNILLDGSIDIANTDKFIAQSEFEARYRHFAINDGDIVLSSSGTLGKVGRINFDHLPLMMNTSVIRLRTKDPSVLDNDYLFAFLRSPDFQSLIRSFAVGGAQQNFGPSHLKQIQIPLPLIETQRRISSTISVYDDLLDNNRRRTALLDEAARLLYQEWFVRFRFPGHEHTRLRDGLPEGWERLPLESVCSDGDGIQTGPFGSQLHRSDYSADGVPVVMPKDLIDFRVAVEGVARIPESLAAKLSRHRMKAGDTVYGRRGDIGRRAFISARQVDWMCGTGCLRIRPNPAVINTRYLFDTLGSPETAGTIANRAKGATMPNLNSTILKSVPVLVAPRRLQDLYVDYVEPMLAMNEALSEQNQKLKAARDLLLPRLMTGEIAV